MDQSSNSDLDDILVFKDKLKELSTDIEARLSDTDLIIKTMKRLEVTYTRGTLQVLLGASDDRLQKILKDARRLTTEERERLFTFLGDENTHKFKPLSEMTKDYVYSAFLELGTIRASEVLRLTERTVRRRVHDYRQEHKNVLKE